MSNSIKLGFIQNNGDMTPFLWPAGRDLPDGAVHICDAEGFMLLVRDINGGSNRMRSISIVGSREAAEMIAENFRCEYEGSCVISRITQESWAVGTTFFDGSYDDGIPSITDLRENAEELNLDVEESFTGIMLSSEVAGPRVLDLTRLAVETDCEPA